MVKVRKKSIVEYAEYEVQRVVPATPGWWSVCAYDMYKTEKTVFYQQTRVVAWAVCRERTTARYKGTTEVCRRSNWRPSYGALCVADDATDGEPMFLDVEDVEMCENANHLGYRREERPWDDWLAEARKVHPELEEAAEPPGENAVTRSNTDENLDG